MCRGGSGPSKVFTHNLRLFAVMFCRQTWDAAGLADILGRRSVNTTRICLIITGTKHARKLERLGLVG